MARAIISRRTDAGWEIISRIGQEEPEKTLARTNKAPVEIVVDPSNDHPSAFTGASSSGDRRATRVRGKGSHRVSLLVPRHVGFVAAITILLLGLIYLTAIDFSPFSSSTLSVQGSAYPDTVTSSSTSLVVSVGEPVVAVNIKPNGESTGYTRSGRALLRGNSGEWEIDPERQINLMGGEILQWAGQTDDGEHTVFVTQRDGKTTNFYKRDSGSGSGGRPLTKIKQIDQRLVQIDSSGMMVGEDGLYIMPGLKNIQKIQSRENLISGACRFNLCVIEGADNLYIHRKDESLAPESISWQAVRIPGRKTASDDGGQSLLLSGDNEIMMVTDFGITIYRIETNGQWIKKGKIGWEERPDLQDAEIRWMGTFGNSSSVAVIARQKDSDSHFIVDLTSGKVEYLKGIKTLLSKLVWFEQNKLMLFDKEGNLYEHQF